MSLKPGYVYHIKDVYFDVEKDGTLMRNHEHGAYRPTYLCIQDEKTGLYWAVPMSSRVDKYKPIVDKDTAKYIDHVHTIGGTPAPVELKVQRKVTQAFKECLRLHKRGAKVVFTDIARLEKLMLDELTAKE